MSGYVIRRVVSEDTAYAIKDAEEALQNAVAMRDWAGVKKYADQLVKLDHKKYDDDRVADAANPTAWAKGMAKQTAASAAYAKKHNK